ncbi:hypothetical protein [Streptomyces sp. bgisy126]|uniref:hypothetical protein n=1 Tax=unclassified Streptomyces TaxID=2593676 RepID=UPI003EC0F87E
MSEHQDRAPLPEVPAWEPRKGFVAVDLAGRIGIVTDRQFGTLYYLRPPGGGKEWERAADQLRAPTETELRWARTLSTPVEAS